MNFACLIRGISRKYPHNAAVIVDGRSINFQQFWQFICAVESLYRTWGVSMGDRVLIVLPNGLDFLVYHFAALKIGAVSVPIKSEYKHWEINHIIGDCEPSVLISDINWLTANQAALVRPTNLRVVSVDEFSYENGQGNDTVVAVGSHSLASINYCYTGDGSPKGAMLTHANHTYAATGYSRHQGFHEQDRFLIILSMSHVYALSGCINAGFIRGAAMVISNYISPKAILSAIQRHGITILSGVPVNFELLAEFPGKNRYDLSSLRRCVTGGAFLSEAHQLHFQKSIGVEMTQGYGLTECLPIVCNPPGLRNKPGTLGVPGRGDIHIKILGDDGQQLPIGEIGQIAIRSPTAMTGYYRRPDLTQNAFHSGWLLTRDLGWLDGDGFLHFYASTRAVINLYGNKVDPLEVRSVLMSHPSVNEAIVDAVHSPRPDRLIGATMIRARVTADNHESTLTESELRRFCADRIANYKVPNVIELNNAPVGASRTKAAS